MANQYFSSLPYGTGGKTGNSGNSVTSKSASAQTSRTSFNSQLNDEVINVFERSQDNIAVPDERTGADRRQSVNRRQSTREYSSVQSNTGISLPAVNRKVNETYTRAATAAPVNFVPSSQKGTLLDIWA